MSYTFEECLQKICKESQLPPEDRQTFIKDAEMIRNHLLLKMQESCPQFKSAFDGLCLAGSYFDGLKTDLPDNFELHIKLKLPFKLSPSADKRRPGYVKLLADQQRDHPVIEKSGKISRYALQMWMRSVLLATIREGLLFKIEGRAYEVQYPKIQRGRGVAHTVTATKTGANKGRAITFDFVPVFEFSREEWPFKAIKKEIPSDMKTWYAVPIGSVIECGKNADNDKDISYVFMVCSPQTNSLATINELPNLKNALSLLETIRDANGFSNITDYMLKSIFLQEFDDNDVAFWKRSTGELLIELLQFLAEDLNEQRLPFLLHKGVNLMDLTTTKIATEYKVKVERALRRLKTFKELQNVNYIEVLTVFMKQKNV